MNQTIHFHDGIEFEGTHYVACTADEPRLLITQNRASGIVTVQAWADRYSNAFFRSSERTADLLAEIRVVAAGTEGTHLVRQELIEDLINGANGDIDWAFYNAHNDNNLADWDASAEFDAIEAEYAEVAA